MDYYKKLFKSFVYAFRGITYCIAHERNMRIFFRYGYTPVLSMPVGDGFRPQVVRHPARQTFFQNKQ